MSSTNVTDHPHTPFPETTETGGRALPREKRLAGPHLTSGRPESRSPASDGEDDFLRATPGQDPYKALQTEFLWKNKNFLCLWLGQILSQVGIRMFQIAFLWWIVTRPQGSSGKEAGFFMVLATLPSLLFLKIIGKTTDQVDTKRILTTSSILCALAVALAAASLKMAHFSLVGIYGAGFLIALFQAFMDPAFNKAVAGVVPQRQLESAVALQSATQPLAYFGGAVAGAALLDHIGIFRVAGLNSAVYLIAAVCFVPMVFSLVRSESKQNQADLPIWSVLNEIPALKKILIGFGFVNFFATPILVILPLYTSKILKASASMLGTLEGTLWIGLLAGTIASKRFFTKSRQGILKIAAWCIFIIGLCLFLPGLIIHPVFCAIMLFFAGSALGVNNVKFMTFFQETVRPEIKGRFFALVQALISFTFPIAYFLFGMLAEKFPANEICLIQGFGVMALAFYFLGLAKRQRQNP